MRRTGLKRLALIALPVVVVVALSLAAVSSGHSSSAKSKFGVNATGTVQFWTRAATSGLGVALVKEFNASHPGLKVVLSQTSPNQDTSKLATAIRAHAVPDVVGLNDIDVPQFSRLNALTDITKQVDALAYKKSLSPGHLALAGYNGKYYGVPYLGDLSVLWYNKSLFTQAGLDPNKPPTTFAADPGRRDEDPGARKRNQRLRDGRQLPGLPRLRDGAASVCDQGSADPWADRPPDCGDCEQCAARLAAEALPAALGSEACLAG